jgi:hypothetical protein
MRSEEIPEEEPEEPEEEPAGAPAGVATVVPSVGGPPREFEFKTEELTVAEISAVLASRLTEASKEGWDFVQVIDAGERRVILYRRAKRGERHSRPVGFFPPASKS